MSEAEITPGLIKAFDFSRNHKRRVSREQIEDVFKKSIGAGCECSVCIQRCINNLDALLNPKSSLDPNIRHFEGKLTAVYVTPPHWCEHWRYDSEHPAQPWIRVNPDPNVRQHVKKKTKYCDLCGCKRPVLAWEAQP